MKKSDLRTGMLVTLRNNIPYYVMLNTGMVADQDNVIVHKYGRDDVGWMPLCDYDDDLCFHDRPDGIFPPNTPEEDRLWDIIKVECVSCASALFTGTHYKTIWEREEDQQ